eukprot:145617-Rhodomonas_salina.1
MEETRQAARKEERELRPGRRTLHKVGKENFLQVSFPGTFIGTKIQLAAQYLSLIHISEPTRPRLI